MDFGSGWLVSKAGAWVPVAYNASVSESMPWKRAAFTSFSGERTVASRGRGPRVWDVEERVVYDWAQALGGLYNAADSDEPLYWVSPLAAVSNYAINWVHGNGTKSLTDTNLTVSDGVVSLGHMTGTASFDYVTDKFPLPLGREVRFGAIVGEGNVLLRGFDAQGNDTGLISSGNVAPKGGGLSSNTAKVTNPKTQYGALYLYNRTTTVNDPYVCLDDVAGVNHMSTEGAWVTLDDVEIEHGGLSAYNPLVTVKFTLTECLR